MNYPKTPNHFTLAITPSMLETALDFASEQQTLEKRKQVFDNTLAVQVVQTYLTMLGITCELASSDSWNPILRYFDDLSDLKIETLGHLECRPVDAESLGCVLPESLPSNRMGLIPVQLDETNHQAHLLGFTQKVTPGAEIKPAHLASLNSFIDYVDSASKTSNLSQWLEGVLEAGWQTAESLIGNKRFTLAQGFMSAPIPLGLPITGAKLIDLNLTMGNRSVVLLIALTPLDDEKVQVRVQLHPTEGEEFLPHELKLELITDSEKCLSQVTSRQFDNIIQLPRFQCDSGDQFEVHVSQGARRITEKFLI